MPYTNSLLLHEMLHFLKLDAGANLGGNGMLHDPVIVCLRSRELFGAGLLTIKTSV